MPVAPVACGHRDQLAALTQVVDLVSRTVGTPEALPGIYDAALTGLHGALGVDRCSILLFDPDGVMRFKAWRGLSDAYRAAVEGHTPWPRDTLDPPVVLVPDVRADPALAALLPTFAREDVRALAFVPLVHQSRLLGKFMLYARTPSRFEGEVDFAVTLGRLVAFAIVRARVEGDLREADARKEELLGRERDAKRDAERSLRLRDEFLSVASHELRTPLTALRMQLQLLPRALRPAVFADKDQVLDLLGRSLGQLTRFMQLVDDLLDVSRIGAGRLVLHPADVALSEVVARVLDRYRAEAAQAGSLVTVALDDTLRGRWDPGRLEQVVVNLLSNALKYGAGRPVHVTTERADGRARLRVRDEGIGIAPEDHERIFGRFERAAAPTHYRGLGVGLYVSRQVVLAHGGTIRVDSAPGRGAEFVVELPLGVVSGR